MSFAAPHDRRGFLRLSLAVTTGALLSGCGGGGTTASADDAVTVVAAPAPAATPAPNAGRVPTGAPLNLALNLAYLGAQYHGIAASGAGLPAALTGGAWQAGSATGARLARLADPIVAAAAAELAADKQAHVVALRAQLGAAAAAQPAVDLSTGATSAFSLAAQGAGIVPAGSGFDPYANDRDFLLGAFFVENAVAAAYRTLLAAETGDTPAATLLAAQLGDAIYHGGTIRTLLADRADADATIDRSLANASTLLATLDGTDRGDQSLAGASGASANIPDADGRPVPFTRAPDQVLKALYLSGSGVGGFFPAGANV